MQILKSPKDKFIYDSITLKNNLDALLIQNKEDSMAYVSLAIDVGSFKNGEINGLAHFLEHMLFMGNSKYPKEDFYHKFITENGGSSNAYTAGTHTCYYFSIADNALEEALDVFSGFFISPLLKEDAVEREINAVNSEHEKNILNDGWRTEKVLFSIQNNNNYFDFHTGSNETLRIDDIYSKVKKFFKKYYSANIMKLVIMSNREVEEQKDLIKKYFSDIPNNNVIIDYEYDDILKKGNILKVVPMNDDETMTIIWQLPDSKYKIAEFINYLLNSQDKNTLINNLLNLNLANYVHVELRTDLPHYVLISLHINLTSKGFKEIEKIYDYVYKYIHLIKKTIIKNPENILNIYKDFKKIINNNFINWELGDNSEYIQQLSALWTTKDISVEKLISYEYTYPDANQKFLEILNTFLTTYFIKFEDNILLQSKQFKGLTDKKEKWYGIEYKLITSIEQIKNNKFLDYKELKLPSKNQYITDYKYEEKKCDEIKQDPILIQEDEYHELYYKYSCKLNNMKTMIFMYFRLKENLTIREKLVLQILFKCLIKLNSAELYKIQEADYNFDMTLTNNGNYIIFSIYGYTEHMKEIIIKLIHSFLNIANYKINKFIFNDVYNLVKQEIHNEKNNPPFTRIINELCNEIIDEYQTDKEFIKFLEENTITLEEIRNTNLLDYIIHYKVYSHGNMSQEEILDIFYLRLRLSNPSKKYKLIEYNEEKYTELIKRTHQNHLERNNAVALVYGLGYEKLGITENWEKGRLFKMMFHMHLSMDFFDDLRTKQQLGYVAKGLSGLIADIEKPFSIYTFVVQSDHKEPEELKERIEKYITRQKEIIKELTDEHFITIKEAIQKKLKEPYINMMEEAQDFFSLILSSNQKIFDYKKLLLEKLEELTKEDYINYFNRVIDSKSIIIQIGK